MLSEEAAPSAALLALSAVVLAPASEELMFRGYLLPTLTKWMGPAAAVSALVVSLPPEALIAPGLI